MFNFIVVILAAIQPLRIVPNKIVYPLNEKGTVKVVVTNTAASNASAEMRVTETWGIEGESREIYKGTLNLTPNECKSLTVEYPGSSVRYGHEVRVTLHSGLSPQTSGPSRSEYFAVNDDWWRVNQGCGFEVKGKSFTPLYRQFVEYYGYPELPAVETGGRLLKDAWEKVGWDSGPFPGYCTMVTRWQMQKCSVGGNRVAAEMPDGQRWYTANGPSPRDSGAIRQDSDISHEWGVHHTRFTINLMEGPWGFELARRNPEFMLRNARGQFEGCYGEVAVNPVWYSDLDNGRAHPWTYLKPNFCREDVIDWALDDLVAGVEGFREDGVYFDGRYVPHQGFTAFGENLQKLPNVNELALRNAKKTHDAILKDHPERFIWSNGPNPNAPETALLDHSRSGLLNEVQWPFLIHPTMACNNYRGFLESTLMSRNMCYLPGKWAKNPGKVHIVGYLCPVWTPKPSTDSYRECWTMSQHIMSILASSLAHPFAGGPQMRNFKQMMMRYSEFFWHEDIDVMKDGYKRFICDSLREVWYDDMIYKRDTPEYTDYYIHLINVPESEMCNETTLEDPPEVDDAEVSTKLFGPESIKAWAIQPYAYLDSVLEPRQMEVPVKTVKDETVFAVPPFKYYTLLVIRNYKR